MYDISSLRVNRRPEKRRPSTTVGPYENSVKYRNLRNAYPEMFAALHYRYVASVDCRKRRAFFLRQLQGLICAIRYARQRHTNNGEN